MADASTDDRPDGLLWRLARLHPAWVAGLIVVSLGFPLSSLAPQIELSDLDSAILKLVIFAAEFVCLWLPLLYVYAVVLLASGRFYSFQARRIAGATICIVILTALAFGVVPMILVFTMMDEQQARTAAIFPGLLVLAGGVSFYYLLVIAARELESAESGFDRNKLRRMATFVALVFWPLGFFWTQARLRSLVREFDTGNFSRLPLEAVGFSEDKIDQSIELTRRVRPALAESYADLLIRRAGGSAVRRKRLAGGMSWDFTVEGSPFRLVFANDPPLFTLHSSANPEEESLFTLVWRLRESN